MRAPEPRVTDSSSPAGSGRPRAEEPAVVWRRRQRAVGSRFPLGAMASPVGPRLLGYAALWLALLGAPATSASKAVTAHLAAKWPDTPLLLEASEFMAEESNEKFWQFLETVRELAIYKRTESEYSYYNLILKKAGQFLDNLHINLLKFALSIRAYSPTIQMFQQIAADERPPDGCDAFVVIHKKRTCKINEVKKLLKKATSRG